MLPIEPPSTAKLKSAVTENNDENYALLFESR